MLVIPVAPGKKMKCGSVGVCTAHLEKLCYPILEKNELLARCTSCHKFLTYCDLPDLYS